MKKFTLSVKPKTQFLLHPDVFEIKDGLDPSNNGKYAYSETKGIELTMAKTNLMLSILSFLVEFLLLEAALGRLIKDRTELSFIYRSRQRVVRLKNYDKQKLQDLVYTLKGRSS